MSRVDDDGSQHFPSQAAMEGRNKDREAGAHAGRFGRCEELGIEAADVISTIPRTCFRVVEPSIQMLWRGGYLRLQHSEGADSCWKVKTRRPRPPSE